MEGRETITEFLPRLERKIDLLLDTLKALEGEVSSMKRTYATMSEQMGHLPTIPPMGTRPPRIGVQEGPSAHIFETVPPISHVDKRAREDLERVAFAWNKPNTIPSEVKAHGRVVTARLSEACPAELWNKLLEYLMAEYRRDKQTGRTTASVAALNNFLDKEPKEFIDTQYAMYFEAARRFSIASDESLVNYLRYRMANVFGNWRQGRSMPAELKVPEGAPF